MRLRAVVCDDTEAIRDLVRVCLEEEGIEVVGEAINGAEAVVVAADVVPDVIVLDLSMPVMDGLQAIPLIREGSPATKIVIMSAFDGAAVVRALEAGANAFVGKDQPLTELTRIVHDVTET